VRYPINQTNLQVIIKNSLALAFLLLISCGQGSILTNFDSQKWQTDKDGCNNQRGALAEEIISRKNELTGLGQQKITELLGTADRHELYSRNKKAFVYFISGGPNCPKQLEKEVSKLVIRFDGIGRAKEFVLYNN